MKHSLLCILLIAMTLYVDAQRKSRESAEPDKVTQVPSLLFTSVRLQNAVQVSREIVKMERLFKTNSHVINDSDKVTFRVLTSTLVWYANLQDDPFESQMDSLLDKLDEDYPALSASYNNILRRFLKYDALLVEDILKLDSTINTLDDKNQKDFLRHIIKPFRTVLLNRGESKAAWKKHVPQFISDQTSRDSAIRRLDTIKNLMLLPETDDSLATLKADSTKTEGTINEYQRKVTNIKKYKKNFDSNEDEIRKQKDLLSQRLQSSKNEPELAGALRKLNGINSYDTWIKSIEKETDIDVQKLETEIQIFKTTMQEANPGQALKFAFPSESEMIDAVAIYLAKRVKQEAVMWFFETIKKDAKRFSLVKSFFPNTITLLQSNEVYEIPNLGSQWRYALSKDFVKMPRNVLESEWFSRLFNEIKPGDVNKNITQMLLAAYDVADLMSQENSFQEIVKHMYLKYEGNAQLNGQVTPGTIFSVLYAFNQECFETDTSKTIRRLGYEDFRNITLDELEIMLSLVDMKYSGTFQKLWRINDSSKRFLDKTNVEAFRKWAGNIEMGMSQFQKVSAAYTKTKDDAKNGKETEVVYSAFNVWEHLNQLMAMVVEVGVSKNNRVQKLVETSANMKERLQKGFEIYNQLNLKNYSGAVSTTISLVEDFFYCDTLFSALLSRENVMTYLVDKQGYDSSFVSSLMPLAKDNISISKKGINKTFKRISDTILVQQNSLLSSLLFDKDREALKIVRKLSGFLNDVMLTTNKSKDLERVVESYAVPAGSYKRKRNSWNSVDLNAYVGAYYGIEWLKGATGKPCAVFGLTAPIGLSYNITAAKKFAAKDSLEEDLIRNPGKLKVKNGKLRKRSNSTWTIDLSVVDLGAVVSYRFSNTSEEGLPQKVKWSQLFSPGLRIGWGIPNSPLIINAGYQFTPELRSLENNGNDLYSAHRVSLGLMFDLPLFHVWQSSYRRK